ncbi:hypothetical protein FHS82_001035 [Pseudochelatococcus lubricantis]|uniref:Uncharacterized protein n=1 Tax=Pseudochelatococcus lubricantis TaxID=1538102 RepID=A0ABX0UY50_9HYPH|nr:hypothetical protein [Pseudochelatococcus lubricantis]NIJ57209.1 hypothetical protein [Pseudochelatococcus lubricantis]
MDTPLRRKREIVTGAGLDALAEFQLLALIAVIALDEMRLRDIRGARCRC